MSDARYVLYSYWRSTAAYRVRVAARLKGLDIEERFIDLDAGKQHAPAFRKINPMGAVPALVVDDGQPLTESLAIIEYLDAIAPESPLIPTDAHGAARVRALAQTTAADLHPLIVPRVGAYPRNLCITSHGSRSCPQMRCDKASGRSACLIGRSSSATRSRRI